MIFLVNEMILAEYHMIHIPLWMPVRQHTDSLCVTGAPAEDWVINLEPTILNGIIWIAQNLTTKFNFWRFRCFSPLIRHSFMNNTNTHTARGAATFRAAHWLLLNSRDCSISTSGWYTIHSHSMMMCGEKLFFIQRYWKLFRGSLIEKLRTWVTRSGQEWITRRPGCQRLCYW